jgi:hypothetical protein
MLRPPVRTAYQGGAVHPAALTDRLSIAGAAVNEDPVRQVLEDEAAVDGGSAAAGPVTLLRFDLGRIAAGNVRLHVRGAVPGTVIDVAAAEHLDDRGMLVTLGQHAGLRYVCAGGDADFESFDIIGTRFLHASVRTPDGTRAGARDRRPAPAPPRWRVVRLLGPAARGDPRGRPAHGGPLRPRRLRRLPHP